jgi:hypothetical protein
MSGVSLGVDVTSNPELFIQVEVETWRIIEG